MPYWLTNPEHGTMPVYDLGEVERNKKFGWTLLNEGESPLRALPKDSSNAMENYWRTAATESIALAPKAPFVEAKRKPGRPPKAK